MVTPGRGRLITADRPAAPASVLGGLEQLRLAVGGRSERWTHLLPGAAIFPGACVIGAWYFNREAPRIAEQL
jgi:hypothetical protein